MPRKRSSPPSLTLDVKELTFSDGQSLVLDLTNLRRDMALPAKYLEAQLDPPGPLCIIADFAHLLPERHIMLDRLATCSSLLAELDGIYSKPISGRDMGSLHRLAGSIADPGLAGFIADCHTYGDLTRDHVFPEALEEHRWSGMYTIMRGS